MRGRNCRLVDVRIRLLVCVEAPGVPCEHSIVCGNVSLVLIAAGKISEDLPIMKFIKGSVHLPTLECLKRKLQCVKT